MSDSTSGLYNPAPGNVSHQTMNSLEYSGAKSAIYADFQPWFCMQSGSSVTGPGTSCNTHIQVGYNSNDPATVKAQMDDMQARGISGPIIDWYGPNSTLEESTSELVKHDLEGRCSGGSCGMQLALMEDQGSITRACLLNGGGTDQSTCITNVLERDLDYMNANYFPSSAYLRVDASTMSLSPQGYPVVFFFICEECFTNPAPNWTNIFQALRQHVASYASGDPHVWFIFRNAGAFSHVVSDGGFAWENHYGSNDPYGLVYLGDFYDSSLSYPTLQAWGAAWKGFDNTLAPWKPTASVTGQQCGNTWLQTFGAMTNNNDYGPSNQLPFLQLVTWNDYEEGTEIETGIDNCLSLQANSDGTNLSWTPIFLTSGSENSVDHYNVYQSTDGQTLLPVATVPVGTHAIPISSLNTVSGKQSFYVQAVGKASILNTMSGAVAYTNGPQPATVFGISPTSGSTVGGTAVKISGTNFQTGAAVSFGVTAAKVSSVSSSSISVTTPVHAAGAVSVTVTNPGAAGVSLASAFTYSAPAQSFELSALPTTKTVTKGTAATYSITVTAHNGYTGSVAFTVSGLPSGSKASFSPASVTTSGSTKLSINTTSSVRGSYTLTISGANSAKKLTSNVKISLTVK